MVGSDSREGLTRKERRELGVGSFDSVLTDTIILLQLDPRRDAAALLSFPRDLYVTLCDGREGRINAAYAVGESGDAGGPSCLVRTVKDLTGIPINHYIEVEFAGFVDFVDRLGGVQLYLDEPIQDDDAHVDLPAGCVTLDGKDALGFVRVRKLDSDFGRIARQQRFIREVVDKVTSARIALDVPRLFRLVDAGAKAVDTDEDFSLGEMRRLAFSLRELTSERLDTRTVPGFNRDIGGADVVVPDEDKAERLYSAFREGEAAPRHLGRNGPPRVRIADVGDLTVLNATVTEGLAAQVGEALQDQGFRVARVATARRSAVSRTRVVYPPERRPEARVVARSLDGAKVVAGPPHADLTVVVGTDLDLAALRERGDEASQEPTPDPEPTFVGTDPEGSC